MKNVTIIRTSYNPETGGFIMRSFTSQPQNLEVVETLATGANA